MTVEEFLQWESGDDHRYELIDGRVVMMAPVSDAHGTLVINLGSLIRPSLTGRRHCRVVAEGAIARAERNDRCYQADVVVTCARPEAGRKLLQEPVLIAEILSPSTTEKDRRIKVPDYRQIPSVREILIIAQDRAHVELLRQLDDDRWLTILAIGLDAAVTLESVGLRLALADLYQDVALVPEDVDTLTPDA